MNDMGNKHIKISVAVIMAAFAIVIGRLAAATCKARVFTDFVMAGLSAEQSKNSEPENE